MQFEELNFDVFEEFETKQSWSFDDLSSNTIIDAYDNIRNTLFHVFKVLIQTRKISLKLLKFHIHPFCSFKSFGKIYDHLDAKGLLYEK